MPPIRPHEQDVEQQVERQRLPACGRRPAPRSLFGVADPVVAAREQADEVQEAVRRSRRPPLRRGVRAGRDHGVRLQFLQPVAERVVLVLEQLHPAPQHAAPGWRRRRRRKMRLTAHAFITSDIGDLADHQDADDLRNDGVGQKLAARLVRVQQPDVLRLEDPEAEPHHDRHARTAGRRRSAAARCAAFILAARFRRSRTSERQVLRAPPPCWRRSAAAGSGR